MRIDDYLSTVGIVKRRTIAKELGSTGLLSVNGRTIKAAYDIKIGDIIHIKGKRSLTAEVLNIPKGSVSKFDREQFVLVSSVFLKS